MRLSVLQLGFLLAALAPAATLEQMSLERLARESTAIVQGRVVAERTIEVGALLYTVKTVGVARRWKGEPGETIEVAAAGGELGRRRQLFGGSPRLAPGTDYILFLWKGPSGRTQITGFSQGVCELRAGPDGRLRVVRRPSSDVVLTPDGSATAGDGSLDLALEEFTRRVHAALAEAGAR